MSDVSFDELIKKPANDNYIFRGEAEVYQYVSSGLFREYPYPWDVEAYQKVELEDAKRYICETDERAILTEIQVKSQHVVWEIVNLFVLLSRSRLRELHLRQRFTVSR